MAADYHQILLSERCVFFYILTFISLMEYDDFGVIIGFQILRTNQNIRRFKLN